MFDRNKSKTTEQVEEKKPQATFSKKAEVAHPVSVQPVKPQKEYTYTLLPNKEESKQKRTDKAVVVPLKKDEAHKVKMKDLFDFCQMYKRDVFSPECVLKCKISDRKIKKFERDLLNAFYYFLKHWQDNIKFDKLTSMKGEVDDLFVKFCEELSNLFDEFFLLPEKYKLFVRELAKAIHEKGKKLNDGRYNFGSMFAYLGSVIGLATQPKYDIFNENIIRKAAAITFLLRDKRLRKFWSHYCLSRKEFEAILNSVNIPNDKKEIQNKLERFANSAFDKNSDLDKESFAERMKRVVEKFSSLEPMFVESRNRDLWKEIKEKLIKNDFFNIHHVTIDGNDAPEKDIGTVLRLLGIIPQNRNILRLQKFHDVGVFNSPKMRRNLFVTMALFVVCLNDSPDNSKVLLDFFKQLTKEERFEIMHSDVQWRGQSFPLLLMFLFQNNLRSIAIDLIRDFVPEVFDIRFKVDEKTTPHDIMGLLKEIKGFCDKKLRERYVKEEGGFCDKKLREKPVKEKRGFCDKKLREKRLKEEEFFYMDLLGDFGAGYIIDQLERIKKQHEQKSKPELEQKSKPKPEPEQKSKSEIEKTPCTKIEVENRRKYEISDRYANPLQRIAAKFR